jgi:hypothetical protein
MDVVVHVFSKFPADGGVGIENVVGSDFVSGKQSEPEITAEKRSDADGAGY